MNRPKHTGRNDRSSWRRAVIWSGAIGALLALLFWLTGLYAASTLRGRLDKVAQLGCAVVRNVPPPTIKVDLLGRRVIITDLAFVPNGSCAGSPMVFSGHLDTLDVGGISLTGLLFQRRLAVNDLRIATTGGIIRMVADSLRQVSRDEIKGVAEPWSVEVASFHAHLRSTMFITVRGDTVNSAGDGIRVQGSEYRFGPLEDGLAASHRVERITVAVDSLSARLIGGYALSIDQGAMDQPRGTVVLSGVKAMPRGGQEAFSATLRHETDVIQAQLDTLAVDGFDLNRSLTLGGLSAGSLQLRSGRVVVLRDKTLPDGPPKDVPLLGELIRRLPPGSGVETITVRRLDVLYREQIDVSRGYAHVPFDQIHATITGVRNDRQDSTILVIDAHCKAFSDVPVSMVLRSLVQDTTDRFELDARIGTMPFASLNQVTGPLMDVRALEGRIDSVIMHMDADDYHAKGLVQLAYHDLNLSIGGRKRKEFMHQVESLLLNTLVKKDNRNSGGPRQGYFMFDRRRDRAIFNYMWSGLREGTKEILLPKALTQ